MQTHYTCRSSAHRLFLTSRRRTAWSAYIYYSLFLAAVVLISGLLYVRHLGFFKDLCLLGYLPVLENGSGYSSRTDFILDEQPASWTLRPRPTGSDRDFRH
jgi:hypothetical protein